MPRKAAAGATATTDSEPRRSSRIKELPKAVEEVVKKAPAKPRAKKAEKVDGEEKPKAARGRKRKEPAEDAEPNGADEAVEPPTKKVRCGSFFSPTLRRTLFNRN